MKLVLEILKKLPSGSVCSSEQGDFRSDMLVFSVGEGPRGEYVHMAVTGRNADAPFELYKVKDPSFINWFALALSVRNNKISDFPLCNKSFDLSYSGNDL